MVIEPMLPPRHALLSNLPFWKRDADSNCTRCESLRSWKGIVANISRLRPLDLEIMERTSHLAGYLQMGCPIQRKLALSFPIVLHLSSGVFHWTEWIPAGR